MASTKIVVSEEDVQEALRLYQPYTNLLSDGEGTFNPRMLCETCVIFQCMKRHGIPVSAVGVDYGDLALPEGRNRFRLSRNAATWTMMPSNKWAQGPIGMEITVYTQDYDGQDLYVPLIEGELQ